MFQTSIMLNESYLSAGSRFRIVVLAAYKKLDGNIQNDSILDLTVCGLINGDCLVTAGAVFTQR